MVTMRSPSWEKGLARNRCQSGRSDSICGILHGHFWFLDILCFARLSRLAWMRDPDAITSWSKRITKETEPSDALCNSLCTNDWFNVQTPHWIPFMIHPSAFLADPCSILHPWDAQLLQTWPGDCPVWGLCLWPSMVQPPTSQQRLRKFVNGLSSVVPFCYFVIFRPASKELNLMFCFCPVFPGFHRHFNVWAWVGIEKHAVWYQFKALETCFKRRAVAPVPKVHQKGLVLAVLQGKHQNTDEITYNTFDIIRKNSRFTGCRSCRSCFGAIAARKDLAHGSSQSFACSDVNPNYVRAPQTVMRGFVPGSVSFQMISLFAYLPGKCLKARVFAGKVWWAFFFKGRFSPEVWQD